MVFKIQNSIKAQKNFEVYTGPVARSLHPPLEWNFCWNEIWKCFSSWQPSQAQEKNQRTASQCRAEGKINVMNGKGVRLWGFHSFPLTFLCLLGQAVLKESFGQDTQTDYGSYIFQSCVIISIDRSFPTIETLFSLSIRRNICRVDNYYSITLSATDFYPIFCNLAFW